MNREPRTDPAEISRHPWDVLVVGAGPAGLFAALGVVATSDRRVLVIDAGPDVEERKRRTGEDYLRGIGGAGLYSDGKLCLSLDVGGNLRSRLPEREKARLLAVIRAVFGLARASVSETEVREEEVVEAHARSGGAGLQFKFYPVAHIGTDRCRDVIHRLRDLLVALGAVLVPNCRLTDLEAATEGSFRARVRAGGREGTVEAERALLALGKVGSALEAEICRRLGVATTAQPMYLGVRLESGSEALRPLFGLTKDPKYSLYLADGTKVKTHCASQGGEVLTLRYDGLPLAGAHNYQGDRTGRSGFSILWNGIQLRGRSIEVAREVMRRVAAYTGGGLLVQTLADYRAGRASTARSIAGLALTNTRCRPGDVRDFLPEEFFPVLDLFLERLEALCPGLDAPEAVLYAPAIEWWMDRIEPLDGSMETSVPGLFVCGDGSGWSQGIVHAAATGLLAAEGITGAAVTAAEIERRGLEMEPEPHGVARAAVASAAGGP